MKIVEVYENRDDGTDRVIMTVKLVGKSCRFDGGRFFAKELKDKGIYLLDDGEHKYLYPKDGLEFMEALSTHYRGSRVWASDVITQPD